MENKVFRIKSIVALADSERKRQEEAYERLAASAEPRRTASPFHTNLPASVELKAK